MKSINLKEKIRRLQGDLTTPVLIYKNIRDSYPGCCLLESVDFEPGENCSSYIGVNPIAEFIVADGKLRYCLPRQSQQEVDCKDRSKVQPLLEQFAKSFEIERDPIVEQKQIANGLFGYVSYDSIQYFEDIELSSELESARKVPDIYYRVYEFVIAINHYKNEMFLVQNVIDTSNASEAQSERLIHKIFSTSTRSTRFERQGQLSSNFSDQEQKDVISKCKEHINRGDVFQIVPSRRFSQKFKGDDFLVYRALRVINPSPYLFFFDFGDFNIFGSSPEAELIVKGQKAIVCPIAGTYPRSESSIVEEQKIEELKKDPKENAEHVMLVDLARNDLSKHCHKVQVEKYREVHKFSHVIHLVSTVSGEVFSDASSIALLADTFPAGTLSGAPKYKAMQLIDKYERGARGIYGGAIGFIDFNGDLNHAIMIRTFLSKNNTLFRQAGGGVVSDSVLDSEVAEVKNKLGALEAALKMAEEM